MIIDLLSSEVVVESGTEFFDTIDNVLPIDTNAVAVVGDSMIKPIAIDTFSMPEKKASAILSQFDSIGFLDHAEYLSQFLRKLKTSNDSLVRILYLGDSQLEGDHVTYALRKTLQSHFGGGGVGLIPLKTLFNSSAGITILSDDFGSEEIHKRSKKGSKYGVFGKYYLPLKEDSKVTLKLKSEAQNFDQIRLLYTGKAQFSMNGDKPKNFQLTGNYKAIDIVPTEEMEFHFKNDEDLKIYGFLADAKNGIAVDNVPFRGVMNPNYYLQDTTFLRQLNQHLNVDLIVLHFGVNVVNDIRKSYSNYKIALTRDVQFLKENFPESDLMIVGVSDMAHKIDGEMVSFENISRVLEVQQAVSAENNIAFWDLYAAMGGEGSILKWYEKGWVRPDYVHLSKEGTNYLGALMAKDLIQLYELNN